MDKNGGYRGRGRRRHPVSWHHYHLKATARVGVIYSSSMLFICYFDSFSILFIYLFLWHQGPGASRVLDKHFTTEAHPQPHCIVSEPKVTAKVI